MWALLGVLVIGVAGGGAWYFFGRQPATAPPTPTETQQGSAPAQQPAQNPVAPTTSQEPSATVTPSAPEPETQKPPAAEQKASPIQKKSVSKPQPSKPAAQPPETHPAASPPPEKAKAAEPVVDERAVKAALATGNLFYDRGDYDNAILEYQKGLAASPGNKELLDRIQAARRAKAAEERLHQ
jgi:cytoskeletal protein RodZ